MLLFHVFGAHEPNREERYALALSVVTAETSVSRPNQSIARPTRFSTAERWTFWTAEYCETYSVYASSSLVGVNILCPSTNARAASTRVASWKPAASRIWRASW